MSLETEKFDGEGLRDFLIENSGNLNELGLIQLVKFSNYLEIFKAKFESDSPDYQVIKPTLERILERIYSEITRRDTSH